MRCELCLTVLPGSPFTVAYFLSAGNLHFLFIMISFHQTSFRIVPTCLFPSKNIGVTKLSLTLVPDPLIHPIMIQQLSASNLSTSDFST